MNRVHRAILFSAIERYGSILLFVLATAVLSRLLTPNEFGIYAVINAFMAVISASFQEIGGANYLIQKKVLLEQDIRTAFTITFTISVFIGILFYFLRGLLAEMFSQDGLRLGIAVSAMNFALTPISTTISALFRREMNFRILAICSICGGAVTATISIVMAMLGYSYMAPIWGLLAGNAAMALLLVFARREIRIFLPALGNCADVIRFGLYSSGVSVINVFYNLAPQLFLARVLDFTAVGLYSRATNATQMFDKLVIQVLAPVIMPAIVAEAKSGGDLKRIYLDAIELLTAVQWPFLMFFAIMAPAVIHIWLGPTWADVVPLIRLLCVAYLALFATCLTYPMLVATKSVHDALLASLIALPPSLLIIFGSSFFGVTAVAAAALVTLPFQAAVAIYFVGRQLKLTFYELVRAVMKSACVALCSSIGALASATLIEFQFVGPFVGLLLAGLSGGTIWLFGLVALNHPLFTRLRQVMSNLPLGFLRVPAFLSRSPVRLD